MRSLMSVLSTCKSSFISLLLSLSLYRRQRPIYLSSLLPLASPPAEREREEIEREREGDQLAGQFAKSFRERKRDEKGQWRRDTHLPLPILSSHNAPHTFSPTSPFFSL
jgi:hypothetical protein